LWEIIPFPAIDMEKKVKFDQLKREKQTLESSIEQLKDDSTELQSKLERAINLKKKLEKNLEILRIKCEEKSLKLNKLKFTSQKVEAVQSIECHRRELILDQLTDYESVFKSKLKLFESKSKTLSENLYLRTLHGTMKSLMDQKLKLERETFEIKENFQEQLKELEYLENSNCGSIIKIKRNLNSARLIRMKKTVQMNQEKLNALKKMLE
jgi:hypothetical protein